MKGYNATIGNSTAAESLTPGPRGEPASQSDPEEPSPSCGCTSAGTAAATDTREMTRDGTGSDLGRTGNVGQNVRLASSLKPHVFKYEANEVIASRIFHPCLIISSPTPAASKKARGPRAEECKEKAPSPDSWQLAAELGPLGTPDSSSETAPPLGPGLCRGSSSV